MIHTELIKNRFDSLEAYEKFALFLVNVSKQMSQYLKEENGIYGRSYKKRKYMLKETFLITKSCWR